jgi:hypothetical protein
MMAYARIDKSDLSGAKTPEFEESELQAMHEWCLNYRDLVRSGERPTQQQDARFLNYQAVCYAAGIACG